MKILVVDDDDIALAVSRKILASDGYDVVLAGGGEAALEIIQSEDIQIVISDWNMPGISGVDLCRTLRASPTQGYIYIIMVTARSSKEDMLLGLFAGADDFISKPFEPAELLVRVRNAARMLEMENGLRRSESRNKALLSAVPDMIFRIRRDGIILDYKPSPVVFLSQSEENMVGASITRFMPDALVGDALRRIEQALRTKEIQAMEYTYKIGDSAHIFEARIKDSGVDEVTAIVRDISDRARLEQMKSDFINRATHELRTPVATMLLMVNLIDGGTTPEEFKEYWNVMKEELSQERLLLDDLLDAGRMDSNQTNFQFQFIDIADILKKSLRQFDLPAREKNIKLLVISGEDPHDSSYMINADERAITQVFVNLLGNAIKFTSSGGSIQVGLKNEKLGVQISILDTGMGIPGEDIPLLFNRFFRGSNAISEEIQGTGIGLFIVRSIVEKHGGTIKVHSEIGRGSLFEIWLPVIQK